MSKRTVLFSIFAAALWWLSGKADKRVQARYAAITHIENITGHIDLGTPLSEFFKEVD